MFICEKCDRPVGPGVPRTLVAVKTRPVTYPFRKDANFRKIGGKIVKSHDKGGQGHETVKEIALCPECRKSHEGRAE